MYTSFLLASLLVLSVVGYYLSKKYWYDDGEILSVILIPALSVILAAWSAVLLLIPPQSIYIFISHKTHIESLAPNDMENAGAVVVKAEQNNWLFGAQYSRKRFGDWSIYPESVLQLEPIE